MIVGVPRESFPGERRVAMVPAVVPSLTKAGLEVVVEAGAGKEAGYLDADYAAKGAKILPTRAEVFAAADIVIQVLCYGSNDQTGKADVPLYRPNQALIGFLRPLGSIDATPRNRLEGRHRFFHRIDAAHHPRAKYGRAFLDGHHQRLQSRVVAADTLPRLFPMMTTAAGTITPARVFIIGCGVAGLQAIATARRLGAVVSAYDLRPAVKEQVQSLGGRFVELAHRS